MQDLQKTDKLISLRTVATEMGHLVLLTGASAVVYELCWKVVLGFVESLRGLKPHVTFCNEFQLQQGLFTQNENNILQYNQS